MSRSHCVVVAWIGCSILATQARAAALLVPAYFDPNDHAAEWQQLTAAAGKVAVTAVFNPNSGPAAAADPAYTAALAGLRTAGGKAVAYVHTKTATGGLRTLATVEAEVDQYRKQYAFDGVFVDEMSTSTKASTISYYTSLYQYVKGLSPAYTVVGNPGTVTASAYAAAADVLLTEEDAQANFADYTPAAWTAGKPAAGFAAVLHDAPAATLAATLKQAAAQNFGYVYVTDDGADGNPYDALPSYFAAEVAAVPEPAVGLTIVGCVAGGLLSRRRTATEQSFGQ